LYEYPSFKHIAPEIKRLKLGKMVKG